LGRVSARPVIKFAPGSSEPSLSELAERAKALEDHSHTGSLQSTRTVLTALVLSATEALEHLNGEAHADPSPALERSVGAIGAYLVHVCSLKELPLGRLISDHFDQGEVDAGPPRRYGRAHRR
jgi:hypothetical protein